jgi:hypothetical protein
MQLHWHAVVNGNSTICAMEAERVDDAERLEA